MFRKAVIIGVGQIGASAGMNLMAHRLAKEVVGIGRDPKNLREAIRRRAIARVGAWGELPRLGPSDLVVLSAPVRTIRDLLKKMPKGPLILDVGSTKAAIVAEASKRRLRFVGCHPIAGTEVPGARGADKNLFRKKICLITPSRGVSVSDLALVRRLWTRFGSEVFAMPAEKHDRLLAVFSHLPHVLAYSLMAFAAITSVPRSLFAGLGSFGSATRVAASSPEMWRDILLENRDAVLSALADWSKFLAVLKGLISRRDAAGLLRFLGKAQKKRLELA